METSGYCDTMRNKIHEDFYGTIEDYGKFGATIEFEGEMNADREEWEIDKVKVTRCFCLDEDEKELDLEITNDVITRAEEEARDWYNENFDLKDEWMWVDFDDYWDKEKDRER